MPCFRVDKAVQEFPSCHDPGTDAGAHGDVDEIPQAAAGAPSVFTHGGGVHVRVEAYGNAGKSSPESAQDVRIPPALLGRGGDAAIGWRVRIEAYRAEGSDAQGAETTPALFLAAEPPYDGGKGTIRSDPRGELSPVHVFRARSRGADDLRSSGFDASEKRDVVHGRFSSFEPDDRSEFPSGLRTAQ